MVVWWKGGKEKAEGKEGLVGSLEFLRRA